MREVMARWFQSLRGSVAQLASRPSASADPAPTPAPDAARGARAAIRRHRAVRRSGVDRGSGVRAARSPEDDGRQDRLWSVLQTGRHQPFDGEFCAAGKARHPVEERRSDGVWSRD